jgi:hypothetical protein
MCNIQDVSTEQLIDQGSYKWFHLVLVVSGCSAPAPSQTGFPLYPPFICLRRARGEVSTYQLNADKTPTIPD